MTLFNRKLLQKRRNRAASGFTEIAFLKDEIAERLVDRLLDIDRNFPLAVDLGRHTGQIAQNLPHGKVGQLIQTDFTFEMLSSCGLTAGSQAMGGDTGVKRRYDALKLQCDEEFLPFADNSLDAILSAFSLHWVNDLVGTLIQCHRALKPDGLLLAALPGPRTLQELREAMLQVAGETGKAAPRIAPFVEVRDAGTLLQRAGFALPVIDTEFIHLTYRDFSTLLREIKQMGESNNLIEQFKGLTTARYWQEVEKAYVKKDGVYPVTVELVFMTAWTPHASQQQPAARGSGKVSLRDAL